MMKILGYDVESVSMAADDVRKVGYLNVNHFYPKSDKRPPFVSAMNAARPDVYTFRVMGAQAEISGAMPREADNVARSWARFSISKSRSKNDRCISRWMLSGRSFSACRPLTIHSSSDPARRLKSPRSRRLADPGLDAWLVRRLRIPQVAPVSSKPAGADPEAFLPCLTGSDVLQVLIYTLVSQIHRIRDAGHWLDRDEIAVLRTTSAAVCARRRALAACSRR